MQLCPKSNLMFDGVGRYSHNQTPEGTPESLRHEFFSTTYEPTTPPIHTPTQLQSPYDCSATRRR